MNHDKSESVKELATALSQAQPKIETAMKTHTAKTPKYSYDYADLATVWSACRNVLGEFGLSVSQMPVESEPDRVAVETLLMHKSGEWIASRVSTRLAQNDPQGLGSAITYLRRYALSAVLGIVTEKDDDGAAASDRGHGHHAKPEPKREPPKPAPRPQPTAEPSDEQIELADRLLALLEKRQPDSNKRKVGIANLLKLWHVTKMADAPADVLRDYIAKQTAKLAQEAKIPPLGEADELPREDVGVPSLPTMSDLHTPSEFARYVAAYAEVEGIPADAAKTVATVYEEQLAKKGTKPTPATRMRALIAMHEGRFDWNTGAIHEGEAA